MLLWFVGGSLVVVWAVFQDPALDFRLVIAGAVLPDLVDGVWGGARLMHSLSGCALLLVVVMVATVRRRILRRRLLGLPIGALVHLVLDGVWTDGHAFWWPFRGWSFGGAPLPSLAHPLWLTAGEEVLGAVAIAWFVARFGLNDRRRLRAFLRSGRLPQT